MLSGFKHWLIDISKNTVSMTDFRRNPSEVIEVANVSPVAILNHNKPAAYLISAAAYEDMLEQLSQLNVSASH
jgi:antitoxin StbD